MAGKKKSGPVQGENSFGNPETHPGSARGEDTVPAWLTPGEAVLNKEAAEILGREKIQELNDMGMKTRYYKDGHWNVPNPAPQYANMGMVEATRYYQEGEDYVVPATTDNLFAQLNYQVPEPVAAAEPVPEPTPVPEQDLSQVPVDRLTGRLDPAAEEELLSRGYVKADGRWGVGEEKAAAQAEEIVAPIREKVETGQMITPDDRKALNEAERTQALGVNNQQAVEEASILEEEEARQVAIQTQEQENADRIAVGLEPKVFVTKDDGTVDTGNASDNKVVGLGKQAAAEIDDSTWDTMTEKVKGWFGDTMDFLGKEEFNGALSTSVLAYLGSRALGYDSDASWGFARNMGLKLYSQARQTSATQAKQVQTAANERAKAYKTAQKEIQTQAAKQAGDKIKLFEQDERFEGLVQSGKWGITGSSAATDVRDFAGDLGITDPHDPAFLRAQDLALEAARSYAQGGKEKVSDLRPFLMAAYLPESAGYSAENLWGIEGTGSEGGLLSSATPTKLADGKQIQELTNTIKGTWSKEERAGGNSATLLSNDVYWLKQAYDGLPADQRKEFEDQSRGGGQTSPFMLFAKTQLGALSKQDSTKR